MGSPPKTIEPHVEEAQLSPFRRENGLNNDHVRIYKWKNVSATLSRGQRGAGQVLLQRISGSAIAGKLIAIMGPSGSGKTTLLNQLAHRKASSKIVQSGSTYINDTPANVANIRQMSSYVEQEDHLIGALTTAETLAFAAKLGLNESLSRAQLNYRVEALLASLGLSEQADVIIGTPIQKGLSGGQKRRVSVASQLITSPKILFLDEPTSGLDSVAAYEVMSHLRRVAKENNLIVIASIHQPSTSTFNLFDNVHLLAKGQLCYGGPIAEIASHFQTLGFKLPRHTNPAEWLLELVDTSFSRDQAAGLARLNRITLGWEERVRHGESSSTPFPQTQTYLPLSRSRVKYTRPFTLLHRMWLKSYRDVLAYWLRVAMYTCLAILMGTCWLRLGFSQEDVQPRVTAIFFGGAFLSFMAVAYIPAYMEDQAIFYKDQANGLYGPTEFMTANFLIGLPYILFISLLFSVIAYWLVNLWPTARGFWTFVAFLFLDMLAAESLVVLVSSILPNFIVALAITAFANGLWMCVNGFLVPETVLNVFWRSWVTKIDYQNWVFRAMMWNEFHAQDFTCAKKGVCAFPPSSDGTTIPGKSVLAYYGYHSGPLGAFAGYIIAIVAVYRLLAWGVLTLRR